MVFNGGDFKNGISFSFRIPQDPPMGAAVATGANVTAKMENKYIKKSCDINSMVFNDGDFENGISFSFRIPPNPPMGANIADYCGYSYCFITYFNIDVLVVSHLFSLPYETFKNSM